MHALGEWISGYSPATATNVLRRIRHSTTLIADFPKAGHPGQKEGNLELVVRGLAFIIVYEVDEAAGEVWVFGVFRGAQDRAGESD